MLKVHSRLKFAINRRGINMADGAVGGGLFPLWFQGVYMWLSYGWIYLCTNILRLL